jgi:hypothetical protein
MSAAELNALEREVELTRAKFANDLARLRSPFSFAASATALAREVHSSGSKNPSPLV